MQHSSLLTMLWYYRRTDQMHANHAESRLGTPISTARYSCPSPLIPWKRCWFLEWHLASTGNI